jgi:unsaturated chondroitin disaccharide hydrolase
MKKLILSILTISLWVIFPAGCRQRAGFTPDTHLDYCVAQASKTLPLIPDYRHEPGSIDNGRSEWRWTHPGSWTCGFWPGILWYLYEYNHDPGLRAAADSFSCAVIPGVTGHAGSHDVGFMAFCSLGNGYRLTGNPAYKQALVKAADSLAALFNPAVGTILSWPQMNARMGWPHNTIIDNMMNLELLFWASKNGGGRHLYDVAFKHAETTMLHHFRPDFSTWHVVVYDDSTGERISGVTHQGYADETMWARGQAWAVYGFTMTYRETRDRRFLDVAQKAADRFLQRLPVDGIPYWDFDAPNIPDEPRDASAAAIVASALIELASFAGDSDISRKYIDTSERILRTLSSEAYQSRTQNPAFLLHSVGHRPKNSEVDASIIYADYYYLEALMRWKKLQNANGYDTK